MKGQEGKTRVTPSTSIVFFASDNFVLIGHELSCLGTIKMCCEITRFAPTKSPRVSLFFKALISKTCLLRFIGSTQKTNLYVAMLKGGKAVTALAVL